MMYGLFATLAAIASLAAAGIVPASYLLLDLGSITLSSTILLVKILIVSSFAYAISNVLSAMVGRIVDEQGESTYLLDYFPSLIGLVSFVFTAGLVGWGIAPSHQGIGTLKDVAFALGLLGGLVVFAAVDVGYLQGPNRERIAQRAAIRDIQRREAAEAARAAAVAAAATAAAARVENPPANPPTNPNPPTSQPTTGQVSRSHVGPILLIGFALATVVGLFLLYVNRDSVKTGLGGGGAVVACSSTSQFVRQLPNGGIQLEVTRECG